METVKSLNFYSQKYNHYQRRSFSFTRHNGFVVDRPGPLHGGVTALPISHVAG